MIFHPLHYTVVEWEAWFTIFRRINAPGVEAENEPLALSDFDETNRVDSWIPPGGPLGQDVYPSAYK